MLNKYDETYDVLVNMAKAKMVMNSHKGDIEDMDTDMLIELAKGELDELKEAIDNGSIINTIEEAADVANFVVAAVHRAMMIYRGRKNVEDTGHTESAGHQTLDDSKDRAPTIVSRTHLQCGDDCESNCKKGEVIGRIHNKVCPGTRLGRNSDR